VLKGRWAGMRRQALGVGLVAAMCGLAPAVHGGAAAAAPRLTYAGLARQALATLETRWYNGEGEWHQCVPVICGSVNRDWGADSVTYALFDHWLIAHDPGVRPIMNALVGTTDTAPYVLSDVPMWDSIAASRDYQVTGNPAALAKAKATFSFVATGAQFARGACPRIYYQSPNGDGDKLKTLETGSNFVKAALLLYRITHDRTYLQDAQAQYAADRQYFLSPAVALYTVYVFDNGKTCRQAPARYFGSVNGNMIWAGYNLYQATGNRAYLVQAIETAIAVQRHLGDATGVYEDLQAENDVTEPLVEAMYVLATTGRQQFARTWLLTAASAAASDVALDGSYGRMFGGPAPRATSTLWQVNGGLALAFAAAGLDGGGTPASPGYWASAAFVADNLRLGSTPVAFTFTGRAVAIIGTIGERCCQSGHARVLIDGHLTFDQTGIWQDKSSSGHSLPGSVLFAWRWPVAGKHTIEILPGIPNAKEGTSFFHMTGYDLVR
jgi:hypothetical protein